MALYTREGSDIFEGEGGPGRPGPEEYDRRS